jgi:hypothetical protein
MLDCSRLLRCLLRSSQAFTSCVFESIISLLGDTKCHIAPACSDHAHTDRY